MKTIKKMLPAYNLIQPAKVKPIMLFCIFFLNGIIYANNLAIGVPVVDQGVAKSVTFTISWDNSWNISGTGVPNNWDAVWLFIKYKDCSASAATPFTHAAISGLLADRTIPAELDVMSTVNLNGTLNSIPLNTLQESAIQAGALDFTDGIMVRRSSVGTGTWPAVGTLTITLKIPLLPAAPTNLTVDVFGIEMVYVPQGNFTLGDGDGVATAANSHMATNTVNTGLPRTVANADETGVSTYYLNNEPAASVATVANVLAAWPKGQCGLYYMKYEITEGQYAEFLNTLGTGQITNRLPGNYNTNRNMLLQTAAPYTTTRGDRAQNYLSFADVGAYLDWACLRFPTETEFEKACRGNGSTKGEYAWGNLTITSSNTFSGAENGTETTTAGNAVYNGTTWTNGDAGQGPARGGIFATSSSTRQTAGASYYGIMDLSGNVKEVVVAMHSTGASNVYTRQQGDGVLDAAGNHNQTTWPVYNSVPVAATTTNLYGQKGGAWNDAIAQLQVSDRTYIYPNVVAFNTKQSTNGGRGVR